MPIAHATRLTLHDGHHVCGAIHIFLYAPMTLRYHNSHHAHICACPLSHATSPTSLHLLLCVCPLLCGTEWSCNISHYWWVLLAEDQKAQKKGDVDAGVRQMFIKFRIHRKRALRLTIEKIRSVLAKARSEL